MFNEWEKKEDKCDLALNLNTNDAHLKPWNWQLTKHKFKFIELDFAKSSFEMTKSQLKTNTKKKRKKRIERNIRKL